MEAKRSGEISFRSFQLGETKRFVYFFLSIRVSFFLLNDSVSRIKDEPMHFAVSKFFTERPRKNFWQEEQVEFSIKYFRLKHLQFSMQIFSSTRIKLFTQILGKRFNLVSVSAKIYAGDVLDRFNIRTRIPPPVNSRSKEGRRYLAASSVSLRLVGRFAGGIGVGGSASRITSCRAAFAFPCTLRGPCSARKLNEERDAKSFRRTVQKKNPASITKPILSRSDIIESKSSIIGGRLD